MAAYGRGTGTVDAAGCRWVPLRRCPPGCSCCLAAASRSTSGGAWRWHSSATSFTMAAVEAESAKGVAVATKEGPPLRSAWSK